MLMSILLLVELASGVTIIALAFKLIKTLRMFKVPTDLRTTEHVHDLPGVSVCIPARNETHAMTQCLENVLMSDYPKLEVIVMDDSSVDDTSILIKSFAHAGVRFVEGTKLPDGWLGKNHALQNLMTEASGAYILYMDVDTRLAPTTISQLVNYIKRENAAMVSVLPRREDGLRASVLFSPLRYFWELLFHATDRPAAASAAWMIDRHVLRDELGGFSGLENAVQSESQFARRLARADRYRFLIGTQLLGLCYEKQWHSQVDTSTRLLYPLIGDRQTAEIGVILTLLLHISPVVIFVIGILLRLPTIVLIAAGLMLVSAATYSLYCRRVWRSGWLLGAALWYIIVVQEIILIARSGHMYRHGRPLWKGRPVTTSYNQS